jgi:hypothetical protein
MLLFNRNAALHFHALRDQQLLEEQHEAAAQHGDLVQLLGKQSRMNRVFGFHGCRTVHRYCS